MSWRPYGLAPARWDPTGDVEPRFRPAPIAARLASSSSPQGYVRPSVPRAAFSHSVSVGRRPPAQVQKAEASDQWAYYQSKGIKATVLATKLDLIRALGRHAAGIDASRVRRTLHLRLMQKLLREGYGWLDTVVRLL